jgi:Protein of unknown function (DUF1566)/PEP-CTERM motif
MKFNKCCVTAAAFLALTGAAQAALQDRDLDGNGAVDAFYDTDRNITWLRDANLNGAQQWEAAVAWADSLSFGGFSDWRLPASDFCNSLSGCTASEMGHLWYAELGNTAPTLTNPGEFENLQASWYWSGTSPIIGVAVAFNMANGRQSNQITGTANDLYAMAVRDGDVPAIPEPGTYALFGVGLFGTWLAVRRQRLGAR